MTELNGIEMLKTEIIEEGPGTNECMGKFRHSWHWVWIGGVWTDSVQCENCGEVKLNVRSIE